MHPRIQNLLTEKHISYTEHLHKSFNREIKSPSDFADALQYSQARITKSVFLRSKPDRAFAMVVCSSNARMNFYAVKELMHSEKIEVASLDDLKSIIGYPPTGVSPIAIPNHVPVFIDNALQDFESVLIGSGSVGVEIEISPKDLILLTNARMISLTEK